MSEEYFDRLVDTDRLEQYLTDTLGPADRYELEHHQEGHSNETIFVTWGDHELVVRRPPPGETAETAHDVLREYRVIDALSETPVPVAPTVSACSDHEIIGSDFYVMERLSGDVLRTTVPERFQNNAARETLGTELVETLAAIHSVDPETVGLSELGRPDGFTGRQVHRWRKQIEWARAVTADERTVETLTDVGEWLGANVPETAPSTLVHGDYKLDNVMYGPGDDPKIVGVFDWEMSTLGDPLTDLGWMLSYWWDPDDPAPPSATESLSNTFMDHPGYSTRNELVARYESATGITYSNDRFYRALAVYKLAALGEMFFRRYLEGNSDDPMYPRMRDGVPQLAARAKRIIDGDEPL